MGGNNQGCSSGAAGTAHSGTTGGSGTSSGMAGTSGSGAAGGDSANGC
jgi:hypothetical protein